MRRDDATRLAGRIALKVLYWAAVLVLSIAILVALILLIESRDKSNVGKGGDRGAPAHAALGSP